MRLILGLSILRQTGRFIKDILWGNLQAEDNTNILLEDGAYLLWEGY